MLVTAPAEAGREASHSYKGTYKCTDSRVKELVVRAYKYGTTGTDPNSRGLISMQGYHHTGGGKDKFKSSSKPKVRGFTHGYGTSAYKGTTTFKIKKISGTSANNVLVCQYYFPGSSYSKLTTENLKYKSKQGGRIDGKASSGNGSELNFTFETKYRRIYAVVLQNESSVRSFSYSLFAEQVQAAAAPPAEAAGSKYGELLLAEAKALEKLYKNQGYCFRVKPEPEEQCKMRAYKTAKEGTQDSSGKWLTGTKVKLTGKLVDFVLPVKGGLHTVMKKDADGTSHCTGATSSAFSQLAVKHLKPAMANWLKYRPKKPSKDDPPNASTFHGQWVGSAEEPFRRSVEALVKNKLGKEIPLKDCKRGDMVEINRDRRPGRYLSGHSVIFLEWLKSGSDRVGFKYWSSQPATKGVSDYEECFVGKKWEGFCPRKGKVIEDITYCGRIDPDVK